MKRSHINSHCGCMCVIDILDIIENLESSTHEDVPSPPNSIVVVDHSPFLDLSFINLNGFALPLFICLGMSIPLRQLKSL